MRVLIYTRVSRDQSGEGRSPAEQEAELRAQCARRGWVVAEPVESDVSVGASRHSRGVRSGYERVVARILAGEVDILATWASDRANRRLVGFAELVEALRSTNTLWTYSDRLHDLSRPDDVFLTGLDALLAERYAGELSRTVRRAVGARAAEGGVHGRTIYGYRQVRDESGRPQRYPDPVTAPVVREMYRRYLAGEGARTLARDLNRRDIPTHTGIGTWSDEQVRRMLRTAAYAGLRTHHGEIVGPATWPAIIERDMWDAVQARRAEVAAAHPVKAGTARLLSAVARCGVCGGKMNVQHDRALADGGKRKVYVCRAGFCTARDATKLETYICDVIVARLSDPALVADMAGAATISDEAHVAATRLADIRMRLDDARAAYVAGELPLAAYTALERQIGATVRELEAIARPVSTLSVDIPDTDDVAAWWGSLDRPQQREIIGAWLSAVVVHPTGRGRGRTFDPSAIEVVWRT